MPDVGGGGHLKVALETTRGTYEAVTKTIPIEDESLQEVRTDPWRMPLMGHATVSGKVGGRSGVQGTITMEAIPEAMAYFLIASRMGNNVQKTGASAPFTYDATDDAAAHVKQTLRSLSIGVDRAGIGFAYLGCQTTRTRIFFEDGVPKVEYTIMGLEETNDYTPSAAGTVAEVPFNAAEVSVDIAGSTRTDLDSLEIVLDDNGEIRYNTSGQEAADYVVFGEAMGDASFEVDFESKADYALWVARTTQELILDANKAADQMFNLELHGGIYDSFEVGLEGLGDQVRASAAIKAVYSPGDSAAFAVSIVTDEDITI